MFKRYLLPGFLFQSVVIGGGYATGRELVEFFAESGPWGGILGMLVSMVIWSLVFALSLELARITRSYDYKSFFTQLLGRFGFLYEILYAAALIIGLSVLGAAGGQIIHESFGVPQIVGTSILIACIGFLSFHGSWLIEKVFVGWSFVLYAVYIAFVILCFTVFGDRIIENFSVVPVKDGWFTSGLRYAGYNLAVIPALLFCVRHMKHRRNALVAGLITGPITIVPGIMFYVAMMGYYPEISERPIPSNFLLGLLEMPYFHLLFQLVVFGTFIETGSALIHGLNERIANAWQGTGTGMTGNRRLIVAVFACIISIYVASAVGIVNLIANGYGIMTYFFIAMIVIPVFTVGAWKIVKHHTMSTA